MNITAADEVQEAATEAADQTVSASVRLLVDDQETSSVVLETDKHIDLCVDFDGEATGWSWQILLPEDNHWVDISGADTSELQVGCGTVISALNEDNMAYLRCRVDQGEISCYSSQLQIHVRSAEAIEPEEEQEELVILSDEQVLRAEEKVVEEAPDSDSEPDAEETRDANEVSESFEESSTEDSSDSNSDSEQAFEEASEESDASESHEESAAEEGASDSMAKPKVASSAAGTGKVAASSGDTAGGELITHYITVEYVDRDGNPIYSGFTAQVKDNTEFKATEVVFPTILGYTPYFRTENGIVDGTEVTSSTAGAVEAYKGADGSVIWGLKTNRMTIKEDNVTRDIHYQVVYYPNKVSYTVTHYVQSMIGDDYVLWGVETKTGYVDEMTDATDLVKDTTSPLYLGAGYVALVPFDNVKIAADGTTQINTYYDRMYYLMRFKLGDGGRGVSPIYAQYESPIVVPSPTRTGYTFDGWDRLKMEESETGSGIWVPEVDENGNYTVIAEKVDIPETMPVARWYR